MTVVTSDQCGLVVPTLYFDEDSARLPASQMDAVRGAAEMFRCLLTTSQVIRWQVAGHAGAGERDPQLLSLQRSEAVIKALVAYGVAAATLEPAGVGAAAPVDASGTPAGGARNREVTFRILARGPGH